MTREQQARELYNLAMSALFLAAAIVFYLGVAAL